MVARGICNDDVVDVDDVGDVDDDDIDDGDMVTTTTLTMATLVTTTSFKLRFFTGNDYCCGYFKFGIAVSQILYFLHSESLCLNLLSSKNYLVEQKMFIKC